MTRLSGLLIVDKPRGPSSHDVVARVRRTLQTRSVGHAGTLDPMATGVLVVMIGACTKMSRFLTLEDKVYRATVEFGTATDTLDAEGTACVQSPVPANYLNVLDLIERGDLGIVHQPPLEAILAHERNRTRQVPPSHSAIKHGGVASYRRARRGEAIDLPPRDVRVHGLELEGGRTDPPQIQFKLHVSKGYYVRSFARDVGERLGIPAHLAALRRLRSGGWGLDGAVSMDADGETLRNAMISLEAVARNRLPTAELTEQGSKRAVHGQRLSDEDFGSPPGSEPTAWFAPDGRLVAVGHRSSGRPTVLRSFLHADEMC